MNYVYNADRHNVKNKNFILRHLGVSPVAAAERVEGMFAHQNDYTINFDLSVNVHSLLGDFIETKTLEKHLMDFCEYVKTFSISEYALEVKNPLRLHDLWEDDPIGSGGPQVVDTAQLTLSQQKEIQSMFFPFSDVIYPHDVLNVMSNKDIKGIKRHYASNKTFLEELNKRKARSKAIGVSFSDAQSQEIVWLDYTLKLRMWALNNGFDSFVYSNEKEGGGADTFVTLLPNQVECTQKYMRFLEDKYLAEMPCIIKDMMNGYSHSQNNVIDHALWGEKNPMPYWEYI